VPEKTFSKPNGLKLLPILVLLLDRWRGNLKPAVADPAKNLAN
jgi:hypothetical protein